MLLSTTRHRFHPRTEQDRERERRDAALRAQLADVAARLVSLEREQQTQFTRIAQLQHQIDELTRLLKRALTRE